MERWYVAQTQALAESKARFHLERQGFSVYLPRYLKLRRHARKTDWIPAPLFPRYLFIKMDPLRTRWLAIRSTIGISHLIGNSDGPTPVPEGVVDGIRARETQKNLIDLRRETPFKNGDTIQITTGSLRGQPGLFECETDEDRVVVLLEILGREVKTQVPFETVAACP